MNLDRLLRRVNELSLFGRIGSRPDDAEQSIASWDEWPGPEDLSVSEIHNHQQELLDANLPRELSTTWSSALSSIVELSSKIIPYDKSGDIWNGPNMAAWHAAWTFSLEELLISQGVSLPPELIAQIYWFERGHWPMAWIETRSMAERNGYLIF